MSVLAIFLKYCMQTRQSEQPQLKAAKELKPISQRVGDAADALLNILMDHVVSVSVLVQLRCAKFTC